MRDIRFLLKAHYSASRALVIGIDEYASMSPLSYAVSDAQAIHDLLVNKFGFPETNITTLLNKQATRKAIASAFMAFTLEQVGLDDRIIVFFAGHGDTRTGSRGEVGYLVPYDADMKDLATLIRWDELTRNAEFIVAKHVLFVMDACYGGLALVRGGTQGGTRFLKDMMLRPSRQVLTAGKADEQVADAGGPIPGHSVFTGHLIEALQGKAANPDGVLTASLVMSYVYKKVGSDKNSVQTPHFGHIEGDGDLIFSAPVLESIESSSTKDLDLLFSLPDVEDVNDLPNSRSLITKAKALLSSDSGAIQLHDVVVGEVRKFLSLTSDDNFVPSTAFSQAELVSRLERYEFAVGELLVIQACIAHWGRAAHLPTLQKSIARSSDRLEVAGGLVSWLALRWYPIILELYAAGIAAVDATRFDNLKLVFDASLPGGEYNRESNLFVDVAARAILELNRSEILKKIPGHERHYTPLSEYIFKMMQPRLDDALFLGKNYETAFDDFEVYFSLVSADSRVRDGKTLWAPIGRFGWKSGVGSPLERITGEAARLKGEWPPLKAGLFGGDYERFKKIADEFAGFISRLSWH
jgi:hypothetical protein